MQRTSRLYSLLGRVLLIAGLLLLVSLRVLNDRDDWILASIAVAASAAESISQEFVARSDGFLELQLDVDTSVARGLLDAYIFPTDAPSELDLRWEIRNDLGVVAAGDARDYLYLEGQPSVLGRLRRILLQVPFSRDKTHWNSLGIAGSRSVARGIGRFAAQADRRYTVNLLASGDVEDLVELAPVFVVRVERRAWQIHYERVRMIGYLGLASIIIALAIMLAGRLRQQLPPRRH